MFKKKEILAGPKRYAKNLSSRDLVGLLRYLDTEYHNHNNKPVPDEIYDIMKDVFTERFPNHPYLKDTGAPVKHSAREKLDHYLPSLDKFKPGMPRLTAWLKKNKGPYAISDKKDGISAEIIYKNHVPVTARTRGNGKIGKNVSKILPSLDIPQHIAVPNLAVRVEILLRKDLFSSKYSKDVGGKFTDARNMVGGLINSNKPSKELESALVVCHNILSGKNAGSAFSTQFRFLKSLGFNVVPFKVFPKLTEEMLVKIHNLRKAKSKYHIDGIVVAADRPYTAVKTGYPDYAVAFKVNSEEDAQQVPVVRVEWNRSKHNKLVPTIWIKPITLGRVRVTKFSGFNAFFIMNGYRLKEIGTGRKKRPIGPGAIIKVIRSGDVIPHIQEVIKGSKSGKPQMPDIPFDLRGDRTSGPSEAFALDETESLLVTRITNFFAKINAEGMKEQTVAKLVEAGYDSIDSILSVTPETFSKLPGMGDKSGKKLFINMHKALSDTSFAKLGEASGIFGPSVGERTLQKIHDMYPDIMDMVKLPQAKLIENLLLVDGVKTKAAIIAPALAKFVRFVSKNKLKIKVKAKTTKQVSSKLAGETVLFTGFRDKELAQKVEEHGGKIETSLKSNVTLLVTPEGYTNTKVDKAMSKGIKVITDTKLRKKFQ